MEAIGSALVAAAAKEASGPIAALMKRMGADAYNKMTSLFQHCFQGHVEATFARCSKMKNILYRDQSVDFLSQYVNIEFHLSKRKIADRTALYRIRRGHRFLVCGTAGAGKTMFMRWSAMELINGISTHGRIPLYLEMRYFEGAFENESLEAYLYDKTSSSKDTASFGQFVQGLKSGIFIVLLDAIDEIRPSLRENVVNKILNFLAHYPLCAVAISSRFDERLESIQDFSVLRTTPMNRAQIIAIIEKLEYDENVKSKLIERLRGRLYKDLEEFLSNPLLATIMLLTFDHSADIPTKLTAFYQQAFEALYQRHDAAKGAYKRDHYAGLPIDRFQAVFSTFSFQTYLDYKFEFTDGGLLEAFRAACNYNQETVDVQLLIRDAMESVCLIQKDGLENVFSHRSFQEYFCALFVSKYREADVKGLIEAIANNESHSNVLKMLFEIAPEVLEYEWFLPLFEHFLATFERVDFGRKEGLERMISAFCSHVSVRHKSGRIASVSWMAGRPALEGAVGNWMSAVESAANTNIQLCSSLFHSTLWDDWDQFRESIPDHIRPGEDFIQRGKPVNQGNADDWGIRLSPSDAAWLVYSGLPKVFDDMRASVRRYHDDIIQRRNNRRQSVSELLSKPRSR
jgi:hypothetical protein